MPNLCIIPSRALQDRAMTPSQLRALLAIGNFTSRAGKGVWAANETLAQVAGLHERDFRRAVSALVERGYVKKVARTKRNGATDTSMLSIVLDEEEPVAERGEGEIPPPPPVGEISPPPPRGDSPHLPRGNSPQERRGTVPLQTSPLNVLAAAHAREASDQPSAKPPAVRLAAAVNAALDAKHGTNRDPLPSGQAAPLVEFVLGNAVPLEWAEEQLYAAAFALEAPPRTLKYFLPGLTDAWGRHTARLEAGAVGDLGARAARKAAAGSAAPDVTIGGRVLTAAALWQLCVAHGLTARGQSREAIAKRVARLAEQGVVTDAAAFAALVLHVRPWDLADLRFERARDERLAAALASWRPEAAA